MKNKTNCVTEIKFSSKKKYGNPFIEVELDVVFTAPDGTEKKVPGFWAGGNIWKVRYSSPVPGVHKYVTSSNVLKDTGLHNISGKVNFEKYKGKNLFYSHGALTVSVNSRHFQYTDGTPFLWLGDTWWKGLCKRMTWNGFQKLAADRIKKGFNAVQIVCGPYSDEGMFEPRWENEAGKPYETKDFSVVNPKYFDYSDRRIKYLVDSGIMPVIVGGWEARVDSLNLTGEAGYKRHFRNLVARYGAYPVAWIVGGEVTDNTKWGEGNWGKMVKYLKDSDPYNRPLTCHTANGRRSTPEDAQLISFDMVGGNHDGTKAITREVLAILTTACSIKPAMPVLCGETAYECHMQNNFPDIQRHIFWMYMLSGAAGHTYGAAGVWQAGVDGDPGITPVYDWTTWEEGMNYPGSTQFGLGKKLIEKYQWHRFEPHPEWSEERCYSAGIPGEVRFIYIPKNGIYNWESVTVKKLEPGISYTGFYFNPVNGKRFDIIDEQKKQIVISAGENGEYKMPALPSPQDWVLVLEKK